MRPTWARFISGSSSRQTPAADRSRSGRRTSCRARSPMRRESPPCVSSWRAGARSSSRRSRAQRGKRYDEPREVVVNRFAVRIVSRLALVLGALAMAVALAPVTRGDGPRVVVLPTTGEVDPFMANYIKDAVQRAQGDGTALLVVELSTPGGRLDSTEDITKALLNATVPTAVWVAPSGGRAASAGTFITLSGALALMAPGTNIGAASPVDNNGQDIPGTLGQKVKNDAIANISAIAKARGRNVDWAVTTVSDAKSYTAEQALEAKAIDGIAGTTDELIAFVNGIIGALSIILAFIGFGTLPLNVGGLLLIALGVILLILEHSVTSHGLLSIGGAVCFVLGASALYTAPAPGLPPISVSPWVIF